MIENSYNSLMTIDRVVAKTERDSFHKRKSELIKGEPNKVAFSIGDISRISSEGDRDGGRERDRNTITEIVFHLHMGGTSAFSAIRNEL